MIRITLFALALLATMIPSDHAAELPQGWDYWNQLLGRTVISPESIEWVHTECPTGAMACSDPTSTPCRIFMAAENPLTASHEAGHCAGLTHTLYGTMSGYAATWRYAPRYDRQVWEKQKGTG